MLYFWYIFFGLAPSIIWLLIFLLQDRQPESKRMILKIFFYGMLAAVFVFLLGLIGTTSGLFDKLSNLTLIPLVFLTAVIISPILEETAKYLVVRLKVISHSEFDEPVDAMIYMIVAALGLAAAENLLLLSPYLWGEVIDPDPLWFAVMRFTGATFLHALASALVGYYLALSFFSLKSRVSLISFGLLMAVIAHGLFNFFMLKINEGVIAMDYQLFARSGISLIILLVSMTALVIYGFARVKKLKSVCNLAPQGNPKHEARNPKQT